MTSLGRAVDLSDISMWLGLLRARWMDSWTPGMSIPRHRKWKLLGHMRATPRIGTTSLLPYSFVQSIHRACPDSTGWIDKLHFLMGKQPGHIDGMCDRRHCHGHPLKKLPQTPYEGKLTNTRKIANTRYIAPHTCGSVGEAGR